MNDPSFQKLERKWRGKKNELVKRAMEKIYGETEIHKRQNLALKLRVNRVTIDSWLDTRIQPNFENTIRLISYVEGL